MRKHFFILTILLLVAFAGTAFAEMEVVKSRFGTMELGANFQVGFNYYVGDEQLVGNQATDRGTDMEFVINRVRLSLGGDIVSKKVKYFFQLEGAHQAIELLDVGIGFKYIPFTTIWVGRFLPNYMHWTPKHTGRLYMIDYPLMYQFFGVQRHTGVDIAFNHKYVDINLGVNNGHDFSTMANALNPADRLGAALGAPNWSTDENSMKDVYFNVNAKPIENLDIFAGLWYGSPLDYWENDKGDLIAHDANVTALNGGVGYIADFGLRVWGEFFYSMLSYDSVYFNAAGKETDRDDDTFELTSMSYYLRLAYNIKSVSGVPLEFLVQYDYLDPDTFNKEKDANSPNDMSKHGADDELTYITAGVNYYISDWHAMLYLNYIYKMEAYKDLQNKAGDDTQDGIANDQIKLQAQIAF